MDAIVAQGSEAGGHRGAFLQSPSDPSTMIGTMALVPLIVDAINGQLPVIAAGGKEEVGSCSRKTLRRDNVSPHLLYCFCIQLFRWLATKKKVLWTDEALLQLMH